MQLAEHWCQMCQITDASKCLRHQILHQLTLLNAGQPHVEWFAVAQSEGNKKVWMIARRTFRSRNWCNWHKLKLCHSPLNATGKSFEFRKSPRLHTSFVWSSAIPWSPKTWCLCIIQHGEVKPLNLIGKKNLGLNLHPALKLTGRLWTHCTVSALTYLF